MKAINYTFRKATLQDEKALDELIQASAKAINQSFYSEREIDAALKSAWVVDKQLILDNTYWIVENKEGLAIGCGGWSKRKLLFGKSDTDHTSGAKLDPKSEPARIRAFFVHHDYKRQGIGSMILEKSEAEAKASGFSSMELVATLSGEKLYASKGYQPMKRYEIDLENGVTNQVVSMYKAL
ncbi:GNAT family N-acetyltransferase [Hyunsoonleella sp. SJ7]|uniref:GNAT family N-acetyltransferase n=1 Tax=Hyunsoonleella aquatilis TaxID=2762758 RepID=A0A923HB21_9FLAO|nr:GNAT family N-acetyltransferase [Hyunsoonleella aquatilis]MBC3759903.1 GNAT family N-acetyltransferase [Hyunsoonleella aquatilis]